MQKLVYKRKTVAICCFLLARLLIIMNLKNVHSYIIIKRKLKNFQSQVSYTYVMYKVQSTKLTAELSRLTFFSRVSFKITIDFKSKPSTPRDMSQVMFTVEDLLTPSFLRHNINKIWSRYLLLKHLAFGQVCLNTSEITPPTSESQYLKTCLRWLYST